MKLQNWQSTILTVALATLLGGPGVLHATPDEALVTMWSVSDETSSTVIDHSLWQGVLDRHLQAEHPSGVNRFDYAALQAASDDRKQLTSYLRSLATTDPRSLARDEQMAYWINLYNALTVFVVVGRYPVDSIKEIKSSLIKFGPWDKELITVQGQKLTLDQIEHGILRPIWRDPRIHYAVNCASIGCPNLAAEAYRSDNLERLLEQGAKEYVNHPRGVSVEDGKLLVSSIYDWYKEDFGDTDAGVLAHLKKYAAPDLVALLDRYDSFDDGYDWTLNAP